MDFIVNVDVKVAFLARAGPGPNLDQFLESGLADGCCCCLGLATHIAWHAKHREWLALHTERPTQG